jgi:hypothetical protein
MLLFLLCFFVESKNFAARALHLAAARRPISVPAMSEDSSFHKLFVRWRRNAASDSKTARAGGILMMQNLADSLHQDFSIQTYLYRPRNEQFSDWSHGPHALVAEIMALPTHAYVLCIDCATVRLPTTLKGKVSLLNGLDVDKHFGSRGYYGERVTMAHKFFAFDAAQKSYAEILVLEEDFLADGETWTQRDVNSFKKFYSKGDFDIIRLGWNAPLVTADQLNESTCFEECQCNQSPLTQRLCTMPVAGCAGTRSSLMYILPQSKYRKFQRLPGIIDEGMFAGMRQTLALPALGYQSSHLKDAFPQRCLAVGIKTEACQDVEKARLERAEAERFLQLCVA